MNPQHIFQFVSRPVIDKRGTFTFNVCFYSHNLC